MRTVQDIQEFCNIISKCHTYPLHYFHDQELFWEHPLPPVDLIGRHLHTFFDKTPLLTYFQTQENLIYGLIHTPEFEHLIVVGPVALTPINFSIVHQIMEQYQLPLDTKDQLVNYLGRTSGYSLPHLQNVLSLINFYLNHETEENSQALMLENNLLHKEIQKRQLESNMEYNNFSSYLAASNYEKETLAHVKNGNVKGIRERCSTSMDMHIGTLAHSSLRQLKNIFICTTTLATRAAIEGGLDLKTAYQLSDLYLQKAENTNSIDAMNDMSHAMFLDFTERVHNAKQNQDIPFDIFECLQYIRQNTHMPLRIDMLASHMHLSKSQLDRKFQKALGFPPSRFILRCKLEEAKALLSNTNRSIAEISLLLCFSSQSHFCNAFRKEYQVSPREYRNQRHI